MNFLRQLLSHAGFAVLALYLLALLNRWHGNAGGSLNDWLAGVGGFLLGFALAHLAHEWSHFLGAVIGRTPVTIKNGISPLFFEP